MVGLINRGTILMMLVKFPTLGQIKTFWSEGYDVIVFVHDVTSKIWLCDSNYIVDVIMRPKFGNSSISVREVITTSIL